MRHIALVVLLPAVLTRTMAAVAPVGDPASGGEVSSIASSQGLSDAEEAP